MTTPATNNDEAVILIEAMARNLATRLGMTAGYVNISVGAGNPDYFFDVTYKHDGYGASGGTEDSPKAISGHGRTLWDAVNAVAPQVAEKHPPRKGG